jgi:SAM-dependent methyltransferase
MFDNAKLYELFQFATASRKNKQFITDQIINPKGVSDVLDFGCGVGYHSQLFKSGNYLGIEPISSCIDLANRKYAESNIKFLKGDHLHLKTLESNSFDLVIAIGVVHHIDNEVFNVLIKEVHRILKPGGRFTTFDPVLHPNQSRVSEWIVKRDRGDWVRTESEYVNPLKRYFSERIEAKIYTNLLRFPYDHLAITAMKSSS